MKRARKAAGQGRRRAGRKASSTGITFVVKYPWGINYCQRLRTAVTKLGLAVGTDPFIEGSDNGGFLVTVDHSLLTKGRQIIGDAGESEDLDVTLGRLSKVRVYDIMQDWKWLEWEVDVPTLRRLGVRLTRVAERQSRDGRAVITFNVSSVGSGLT